MKVTRYKHRLEHTFYVTPAVVWEWRLTNSTSKKKIYTVGLEFAKFGLYMDIIFGEDKMSQQASRLRTWDKVSC